MPPPSPSLTFPPHTRLLVVGAGGIGCELLKTLALTPGCGHITVLDLDTIDVSNLNRQFLFRRKHVGKSKAQVAAEAVKELTPSLDITWRHANIKDVEFGREFFEKFTLVINALDNVNARMHVNRMCLAANKPLIEAGTTGYLGQVYVICKKETECYDCTQKKEGTRYPICTIRSTPDKPVHCIVWAKELFKLLFGKREESDLVDLNVPASADGTSTTTQQETLNNEFQAKSVVMDAVKSLVPAAGEPTREELMAYGKRVFDAVYAHEIQIKLDMRDGYKTAKFRPASLTMDAALKEDGAMTTSTSSSSAALASQRLWTIKECAEMFLARICDIITNPETRDKIGSLEFSKDDALSMDFVCAAANLRCRVFSIEQKSPFDVKGIAGNIIHAIATTNAIAAGLQVLEAVRVTNRLAQIKAVAGTSEEDARITCNSRFTWIQKLPMGNNQSLLTPTMIEKPKPGCITCGRSIQLLGIDCENTTLGEFLKKVLQTRLGLHAPSVSVGASLIYESGADLDEEDVERYSKTAAKTLKECPGGGIMSGSTLSITDALQDVSFDISVTHFTGFSKTDTESFVLETDLTKFNERINPTSSSSSSAATTSDKGDDDVMMGTSVVVGDDGRSSNTNKRARMEM